MTRPEKITAADSCLGCASCVAACPVSAADPSFAGPKVLGPAVRRRQTGGWPGEPPLTADDLDALGASLCLQCHQCDLACPSGLAVSAMTRESKALAASRPDGVWGRSVRRLLVDQERFGRMVATVRVFRRAARRLSPTLTSAFELKGLRVLGLSPSRSLPEPPARPLRALLRAAGAASAERQRPPILFYAGCHARFHAPAVARAAVSVLQAGGYRVILPAQVCCAAPALGAGREELAARAAEANARLLGRALERAGAGTPIVTPCPSCTLALRESLPALVASAGTGARELAVRVAGNVWDLGEFLAGPARSGLEEVRDRVAGPGRSRETPMDTPAWAYHVPCHLRALGVGRPFPELFAALGLGGGVDPGPAADGCCGMGGLSGLTREGFARSLAVGAPVLGSYGRAAEEAGAARPLVLLSDCPACRWQIADATRLATAHPVEFIARLCRVG